MTDDALSDHTDEVVVAASPDWDSLRSARADRLNIAFEAMTARQQAEFLAVFEGLVFGPDA